MIKTLYIVIAAAFIGLAVLVAWRMFGPAHFTNYPPHPGPIVAFGDSLVAGLGATEGHDFVSMLSARINEPIQNFGVPNDTTAMGLSRLDEVVAVHPRIAIVLLGGNDYLRRVPKDETFKNVRTIIEGLQSDGTLVVLLGIRGGLLVDNFASDFKKLASDTKSVYVSDVLHNLLGNKQYMFDEVHPNDQGYAIIAERVYNAMRPVLSQ